MSAIIEEIKRKSDLFFENGASDADIRDSEKALGLLFAEEYKEYLQQFGAVSCGGHELTGISRDNNYDVVNVTLLNLQKNSEITIPLYVIEETHIDGIVIWQASTGEIYQSEYKKVPLKIYDSLLDYVSTFKNS